MKGTAHKYYNPVGKVAFYGVTGKLFWYWYMYTGIEKLSKWMADGGNEIFSCWHGIYR